MSTREKPVHASMNQFQSAGRELLVGGIPLERLVDRVGQTPFYAYDRELLTRRVAELRESTRKELAATLALRLAITDSNWSLKVSDGFPEDPEEDIAAGAWAGVVPLTTVYGEPQRAPDCDASIPTPDSVLGMANRPL